jgi:hypothetical protein
LWQKFPDLGCIAAIEREFVSNRDLTAKHMKKIEPHFIPRLNFRTFIL